MFEVYFLFLGVGSLGSVNLDELQPIEFKAFSFLFFLTQMIILLKFRDFLFYPSSFNSVC